MPFFKLSQSVFHIQFELRSYTLEKKQKVEEKCALLHLSSSLLESRLAQQEISCHPFVGLEKHPAIHIHNPWGATIRNQSLCSRLAMLSLVLALLYKLNITWCLSQVAQAAQFSHQAAEGDILSTNLCKIWPQLTSIYESKNLRERALAKRCSITTIPNTSLQGLHTSIAVSSLQHLNKYFNSSFFVVRSQKESAWCAWNPTAMELFI